VKDCSLDSRLATDRTIADQLMFLLKKMTIVWCLRSEKAAFDGDPGTSPNAQSPFL